VPPGDPAALAAAAERLMNDPAGREALSRRARQAAQRFRWRAVAEGHLEFLNRIADAFPRRADRPLTSI
jgi:glycosyltransferase involved in cell wall biosynthesis